jgi:hypothetical protein
MSSLTGRWIALVAGNPSLNYLMERYTERSGLRIEIVPDPPPADLFLERGPAIVWFPSLDSLARWRAEGEHVANGEAAVVVCTSMPDERNARELGADYCLLLPLTYDDFRAAVSAVGVAGLRDA